MLGFFAKLNTLAAVIAALVVFLVADGFLFYRYQQLLQAAGSYAATTQATAQTTLVSAEEDPGSMEHRDQDNTTTTEETTVSEEANVVPESWEDGRSGLEQNPQADLSGGVEPNQGLGAQTEDAGAPPVEDEGLYPGFLEESGQFAPFTPAPQE